MSKQTIGEFLSALRKANGYTQEEIAEKLGVSNRTLSSWETDRTAPEVTLLPVIADIYGVTVDEILRGERRQPNAVLTPQGEEKHCRRLLKRKYNEFSTFMLVLTGVTAANFILLAFAVVCLFFLSTVAGFVCFAVGVTGSATLLTISKYLERQALHFADDESVPERMKNDYRLAVAGKSYRYALSFLGMISVPAALLLIAYSFCTGIVLPLALSAPLALTLSLLLILSLIPRHRYQKTVMLYGNDETKEKAAYNKKLFWKTVVFLAVLHVLCAIIFLALSAGQTQIAAIPAFLPIVIITAFDIAAVAFYAIRCQKYRFDFQ